MPSAFKSRPAGGAASVGRERISGCPPEGNVVYYRAVTEKGALCMELYPEIDLQDCPLCQGPGILEEEEGWCLYVACLDCGCHTAELSFSTPEERLAAAKQAARFWNVGKVIHTGVGD